MRSMSQRQQHLELPSLTDRTKHGSQDAQYQFGRCHLKGVDGGLPRSHDQSTDLFLRAAQQQGHVEAPWNLAAHAMTTASHDNDDNDDENDVVALDWCQQAATQSHPVALACMGRYYLQGKAGLTRNAAKAYEYYQLAAKQGNADALFQVAQMLERGLGCMHDFQQAAQCYTRLIQDCACPESMFCLGNLYMMGDGVPMDTDRAFSLWEKAAKLGHEGAQSFVTLRDLAL